VRCFATTAVVLAGLFPSMAQGQPKSPGTGTPVAAARKDAGSEARGTFNLLPKSLQRRPQVDFNVLTTLTPAGKQLPVPSAERPAFYMLVEGMNRNLGVGAEHGLKSPPVDKLKQVLKLALAESGYRESDAQHPAALVIFFHWGSSSFNPDENADELEMRKVLMDRARLIGGENLARQLAQAIEEMDLNNRMPAEIAAMATNPIERLMNRSPEIARQLEEVYSSSYFVVASAFDYASLAQNRQVLLWRTKMTVNTLGVNMVESVPPLIASAAPYFGRDMEAPMLVSKRISRDGKVEIGEAKVVEEDVKQDQSRKAPPLAPKKP
jgi:hypothetical protein